MQSTSSVQQGTVVPEPTTGDLVKQMSEQVSTLIREELKLAQLEMTRKGKQAGTGFGLMGGGGMIALYGVGCLIACAVAAISLAWPIWLAALIVGAVLFIVAGIVAAAGRGRLRRATPVAPQQTIGSVKADVAEIKGRAHP